MLVQCGGLYRPVLDTYLAGLHPPAKQLGQNPEEERVAGRTLHITEDHERHGCVRVPENVSVLGDSQ